MVCDDVSHDVTFPLESSRDRIIITYRSALLVDIHDVVCYQKAVTRTV